MQVITFIKLLYNNWTPLWNASGTGWRAVLVLATNDPKAGKVTKEAIERLIKDVSFMTDKIGNEEVEVVRKKRK